MYKIIIKRIKSYNIYSPSLTTWFKNVSLHSIASKNQNTQGKQNEFMIMKIITCIIYIYKKGAEREFYFLSNSVVIKIAKTSCALNP